jgi:hypothetical protein
MLQDLKSATAFNIAPSNMSFLMPCSQRLDRHLPYFSETHNVLVFHLEEKLDKDLGICLPFVDQLFSPLVGRALDVYPFGLMETRSAKC